MLGWDPDAKEGLFTNNFDSTDDGKAFEDKAGTTTSSTADDILDFSERNPFGEVDDY